jgi:hypothetical protein
MYMYVAVQSVATGLPSVNKASVATCIANVGGLPCVEDLRGKALVFLEEERLLSL